MQQIPGVENAAVGLTLPYERALNDRRHAWRRTRRPDNKREPTWST